VHLSTVILFWDLIVFVNVSMKKYIDGKEIVKENKKFFQNPLTNSLSCGIIYV
jgi:hypothetical protein